MTQRCLPGSRGLQRATGSCSGVSGRQRPAPPGRGGVLVPRGVRRPQGAGPGRRRRRRAAATPPRPENRFLVAHWGVIAILGVAAAMIVASGATSSDSSSSTRSRCSRALAATAGCARLSLRDGRASRRGQPARRNTRGGGAGAQPDPPRRARGTPRLGAVAVYLYRAWVGRGRPAGWSLTRTERGRYVDSIFSISSMYWYAGLLDATAKTPRPLSPARLGSSNPTWQQTIHPSGCNVRVKPAVCGSWR